MTTLAPGHPVVIRREWPWGLAFVADAAWSKAPPMDWIEHQSLFADEGQIVVKIQHQVDGPASLELSLEEPDGCRLLSRADVAIPTGRLRVTDAGLEHVDEVTLAPGRWRAAVWVDRTENPSRVVVSLQTL